MESEQGEQQWTSAQSVAKIVILIDYQNIVNMMVIDNEMNCQTIEFVQYLLQHYYHYVVDDVVASLC